VDHDRAFNSRLSTVFGFQNKSRPVDPERSFGNRLLPGGNRVSVNLYGTLVGLSVAVGFVLVILLFWWLTR
jgi:hypothetical protein